MWKRLFQLSLFTVWTFITLSYLPLPIEAQVIISEIAPNPTQGYEWIELINLGNQPVDLKDYFLTDLLSVPSTIYTFSSETQFQPDEIRLIYLSSQKLNNTGDGVSLVGPDDTIHDSVVFNQTSPDMSWHRSPDLASQLEAGAASPMMVAWKSELKTPTPTINSEPSITPTPHIIGPTPSVITATSSASLTPTLQAELIPKGLVRFSEINACADNQGEWVEIFNDSPLSIDLNHWFIEDSGKNKRYFDTIVSADGWATASWSEHILNNSGDLIILIDDMGRIHDSISLPACQTGSSYALINNVWQITNHPSFNLPNFSSNQTPTSIITPSITPTHNLVPTVTIYIAVSSQLDSKLSPSPTNINQLTYFQSYLSNLKTGLPMTSTVSGQSNIESELASLDLNQDLTLTNTYYLWSAIMGGLLLIIGGVFITHARLLHIFSSSSSFFG